MKIFLYKLFSKRGCLNNLLSNFLNLNRFNKSEYKFNDLTPTDDADKDNRYSIALWQALKNNNISNIAITGTYGSGKSSVLRTFIKRHKKRFEFLNITLGTYENDYRTKKTDEERNLLIEKSLLQQILYKVENASLPESRINRIIKLDWKANLSNSVFLIFWALSIHSTIKPEYKVYQNLLSILNLNSNYVGFYAIVSTLALLQLVLNKITGSKLSKVTISSGELAFNEEKGDSIFNKHLDELLYFFSKTKFNVVVIEDLDRFDDVGIFIKLRELNTLINNSDQICVRRKPIKFVYAIRDEVFQDVDRTKFFDFIIPIIPVINASNSAEMLMQELNKAFPQNQGLISQSKIKSLYIPKNFINDVTLFIDDMRLLRNVINEFVIYRQKLSSVGGIDLRDDKLLGFIIYKNKFPKDFANLNYLKGMVAKTFVHKKR